MPVDVDDVSPRLSSDSILSVGLRRYLTTAAQSRICAKKHSNVLINADCNQILNDYSL